MTKKRSRKYKWIKGGQWKRPASLAEWLTVDSPRGGIAGWQLSMEPTLQHSIIPVFELGKMFPMGPQFLRPLHVGPLAICTCHPKTHDDGITFTPSQ